MAHSNRPGRPLGTDPKADETLVSQWLAARAQGVSRAKFARSRGMSTDELEKTVDRHRGRLKAAAKSTSELTPNVSHSVSPK